MIICETVTNQTAVSQKAKCWSYQVTNAQANDKTPTEGLPPGKRACLQRNHNTYITKTQKQPFMQANSEPFLPFPPFFFGGIYPLVSNCETTRVCHEWRAQESVFLPGQVCRVSQRTNKVMFVVLVGSWLCAAVLLCCCALRRLCPRCPSCTAHR